MIDPIWMQVRELNRAWTSGSLHELAALFDEHAVLVTPDLQRVEGRDAIVQTYRDYTLHNRTESFEELEHQLARFGDLAVITYRYVIRYQPLTEDEVHEERGQETLVLRDSRILFRTQSPA